MTIYKFSTIDKKPEKKDGFPDVVTIPLTDKRDEGVPKAPAYVLMRPRRSRACANVIVVFMALVVLAAGVIGGIYLYKHLTHKAVYLGRCGVHYYEEWEAVPEHHTSLKYMEESISVPNPGLEKIEVPRFDECESSLVLHDFESNYTAIVDKDEVRCFIMPLNRSLVAPPRDLLDLIWKLRTGYYMPDALVVRHKYRVVLPPLENLNELGPYIALECQDSETFLLEHVVGNHRVWKRSADDKTASSAVHTYGVLGLRTDHSQLAKFEIYMDN